MSGSPPLGKNNPTRTVKYKVGLFLFSLVYPIYVGKQCKQERSKHHQVIKRKFHLRRSRQ